MKKNSLKYLLYAVLVLLMGVALISCGSSSDDSNGGGTDTTGSAAVTGVAATGAPVSGEVWLKDSTGTEYGPAIIAMNGTFSFDVTGLTAPFYLKAVDDQTGEVLYSVAMDPGTANINPLTNLAVAVAAGVDDPALVYDDPVTYPITQAALDQAIADILAGLDPLFKGYDCKGQNPLTDPFEANGEKLDGFFDDFEIDILDGVVTFRDKDSGDEMCKMSVPDMENTCPEDTENIVVQGEGVAYPVPVWLNMDVNGLSLSGKVNGGYSATGYFGSSSITGVSQKVNGDIKIQGSATCTDLADSEIDALPCTFTVTLTDNNPDLLDLLLLDSDSNEIYSYDNVVLTNGTDFTVTYN